MTPLSVMLIGTGVNAGLVVLLAADKWVHKVTGATPLEARIVLLEGQIQKGNERLSEKMSELTTYLDKRREVADQLSERVSSMEGELRAMRNQNRDGSLREERRASERRRE